jgi:hypothetical protein
VGFGTPLSLVIGLILISGGLVLFFLDNIRPDLKRDSDNVYAVLGILAGILGVISFNKDIVPSMEQMILAGMCIFLMYDNVQKRTPNPDAKRSFPGEGRRDDDRFSRRPYRAERTPEYDEFAPPSRSSVGLRGDYEGAGYSRRGDEGGYADRSLPRRDERDRDRARRDRPNRSSRFDDSYGAPRRDERFGDEPRQIPARSGNPRPDDRNIDRGAPPRMERDQPRHRRNLDDRPPRRRPTPDRVEDVNAEPVEEITSADYVDFTPIESTDKTSSSSGWGRQE